MSLRSARPQSLANVTYLELVLHSTVAGSAFSRSFGTPKQRPIQVFGLRIVSALSAPYSTRSVLGMKAAKYQLARVHDRAGSIGNHDVKRKARLDLRSGHDCRIIANRVDRWAELPSDHLSRSGKYLGDMTASTATANGEIGRAMDSSQVEQLPAIRARCRRLRIRRERRLTFVRRARRPTHQRRLPASRFLVCKLDT
jgi:hypothetical protein